MMDPPDIGVSHGQDGIRHAANLILELNQLISTISKQSAYHPRQVHRWNWYEKNKANCHPNIWVSTNPFENWYSIRMMEYKIPLDSLF
jgi:hypothetical protein